MKKTVLTILTILCAGFAHADQAATLTCSNSNIILTEKVPYFGDGEDGKYSQHLYVLKSVDNQNESSYTAYFLDVEFDIGPGGGTILSGRNSVGGSFEVRIAPWQYDESSPGISGKSAGSITYHHGPLRGSNEPVDCTLN